MTRTSKSNTLTEIRIGDSLHVTKFTGKKSQYGGTLKTYFVKLHNTEKNDWHYVAVTKETWAAMAKRFVEHVKGR